MIEENFDVRIKARVDDYLDIKKTIQRRFSYEKTDHIEILHFSSKPVDYDNLRSDKKCWVKVKDGVNTVGFRMNLEHKDDGIIISEDCEFDVPDMDRFTELMESMGIVVFAKEIINYNIFKSEGEPNLTLTLTNVDGLGNFLEIDFSCTTEHDKEFAWAKVNRILETLGIPKENIEHKFYLQLLLEMAKDKNLID